MNLKKQRKSLSFKLFKHKLWILVPLSVIALLPICIILLPNRSIQAVPTLTHPTLDPNRSHRSELQLKPSDRRKLLALQKKFKAQNWGKLPIGDRIQKIAQEFLGDPYQANLLEQNTTEQLFVSLKEFDCVLFIETVLALNSTLSELEPFTLDISKADHLKPIQEIEPKLFQTIEQYRYRNQTLDGYCSRLHYFSDWILENQQRKVIENIGISKLTPSLNFMSQNWQKYPPMVRDRSLKTCIQTTEKNLTQQLQTGKLTYIPINSIHDYALNLKAGDVIGLVTNMPGLDVTHSGFLYRNGTSQVGLLHASPRSGIKISPNLESYVRGVEGAIGIVVARPL